MLKRRNRSPPSVDIKENEMDDNQLTIFDFMDNASSTPRVETAAEMQTAENVSNNETKNLTDFGEKIGFARKDLWHEDHLGYSDLAKMSDKEKRQYVNKNNVFPSPKWKDLAKNAGYDKIVLFAKKRIRDSLPTVPAYSVFGVDEANKYFIELVGGIRDALSEVEEYEDFEKLNSWLEDNGFVEKMRVTLKGSVLNIRKVYRAIQEVQPRYKEYISYKMYNSKFLKAKGTSSTSLKPKKKKLKVEELKSLKEKGFNYIQRDVTPDDILSLGFRGGEFGNWTSQAERQQHLNMTYNAINNVATALEVTPQQFLYPGAIRPEEVDCEALAVGFGSRGHSNALAHYEPLFHVINLTRMKGAGSLGHELGHAFDYMIRNAVIKPRSNERFAFESCQWKGIFTNENVRLALLEVWNAIHTTAVTSDGARIGVTKFVRDAKTIDANYSKCGHGYWKSDTELFARAWACYLKDKLLEKGIVDDYLCGHADNAPIIKENGEKVYISPQGKERELINEAFDSLINVLKNENFF